MEPTTMIRPGLLLGLKTAVTGGVSYHRREIERDGGRMKKWETVKTVSDPDELSRAQDLRSKVLSDIRRVCAKTSFGLLCANVDESKLDDAIRASRAAVAQHNMAARSTRIELYVLKGRIADNDEVAARSIASDVADLIGEMARSIDSLDVESIRRAATQAREMLSILSDEKQAQTERAIEAARKAARTIVARVQKKGDDAAAVLVTLDKRPLEAARMAFLDMGADEPAAPAAPSVDAQRFVDIAGEAW